MSSSRVLVHGTDADIHKSENPGYHLSDLLRVITADKDAPAGGFIVVGQSGCRESFSNVPEQYSDKMVLY